MEVAGFINFTNALALVPVGSFLAGLFATPHCAVMCGPLFLIFGQRRYAYHIGRITGYTLLGLMLGSFGLGLEQLGILVDLQNLSIFVVLGLVLIYVLSNMIPASWLQNIPGRSLIGKWMAGLRQCPVHYQRPAIGLAGLLSALLPCAVLIPLWALAASSASPAGGALMALGFVLGTLPGAFAMSWLASRGLWQRLRSSHYVRAVSAIILIVLSALVLMYRFEYSPDLRAASPMRPGDLNCGPAPLVY